MLILILGHSDLPEGYYGAKCNFFDVFTVMIPILYQVQLKGFIFYLARVAQLDKRVGWSSKGCKMESRMLPQVIFYIIFCYLHFFLGLTKGNIFKPPSLAAYKSHCNF